MPAVPPGAPARPRRRARAAVLLAVAPALLAGRPARACGPFYPHSLLSSWSEAPLLSGPHGDLVALLSAAGPGPGPGVVGSRLSPAQAEDQAAATELAALPPAAQTARRDFRRALDQARRGRGPLPDGNSLPADIPEPWRAYLDAAWLHAAGEPEAALAGFLALAARPPAETGSRGLWATYMVARLTGAPAAHAALHARVAAGAPDPLGLSAAALGWEARELWAAGETAAALDRYRRQLLAGDPSARRSLEIRLDEAMDDPARRRAAMAHPAVATALAAWMVTPQPRPDQRAAWLAAPESAAVAAELQAWVAWLARDLPRARAALAAAPPSPLTHWLGARLAMIDGDVDAALAALASARFPPDLAWQCQWGSRMADESGPAAVRPAEEVASERGALLLRSGAHTAAARAFAEAGNWRDTAHVVDRVLTLDELETALDDGLLAALPEDQRPQLQALVARRLTRAGALDRARALHGPAEQAWLDAVVAGQESDTAAGLWEAARLVRAHGMALMGTELEPDVAWLDGSFAFGVARRDEAGLLAPTPDERGRMAAHAPTPDTRFHYRHVAAALAWEAAARMPADDPMAPRVLCTAGRWLMVRDPAAADRFYKAMVWRAWGTPLGTQADQLRWFPPAADCAVTAPPTTAAPPGPWARLVDWLGGDGR